MKKTPLYDKHIALGAKIIDFGGWLMPVQYSGIIKEHNSVRKSAGLFDISHMGEIMILGRDGIKYIDYLATNDISGITPGKICYTPLCYPGGGCVDDILVYCIAYDRILLVVNASNINKDLEWINKNRGGFNINIENLSKEYALIALQGPKAQNVLQRITDCDLETIGFFEFNENVKISGIKALVSRTGYTGEDGFEIYISPKYAEKLFSTIIKEGGDDVKPCGLGARDTLRFESCFPLYGHELKEDITPLEAGLKQFVKFENNDFIGRKALEKEVEKGMLKKIIGFEMIGKGIARHRYEVYDSYGDPIGFVTSGSYCPSLLKNMGLALVNGNIAESNNKIYIGIRKNKILAKTVKKPFYRKKYKKAGGKDNA